MAKKIPFPDGLQMLIADLSNDVRNDPCGPSEDALEDVMVSAADNLDEFMDNLMNTVYARYRASGKDTDLPTVLQELQSIDEALRSLIEGTYEE